ncbi:hypothetical protein K439DRAFT_1637168 [Ramaria rubella]|nr:hypothetical protein K439DRAFT_1637168 [Ramaria rubella]
MRNRNTLPLLARAVPIRSNSPAPSASFEVYTATPPQQPSSTLVPAIRLVQATPSPDSTANPDTSLPASILAPKEHQSPRKKLVPKKSKLALLTSRASGSSSTREKDLSDVVRRVGDRWGMDQDGTCNVTVNGGTMRNKTKKSPSSRSTIDIYVDPADDPDIGEIVVVKKKKSRAALDGIRWALGEVTNGESAPKDEKETEKVKIKLEEKEKWWSIGRGRRDSKDKDKDATKLKLRAKAPSASAVPTLPATQPGVPPRPRNHSLDSGLMLSAPTTTASIPTAPGTTPFLTISGPPSDDCFSAHPRAESHYAAHAELPIRPRFGSTPGLLQPPDSGYSCGGFQFLTDSEPPNPSGSLAVRAMRSVKSIARIGSWAQLRNTPAPGAPPAPSDSFGGADGGKKKKAGKKNKEVPQVKTSSSSWEVGALSTGSGSPKDDTTFTHRYASMAALGLGRAPQAPEAQTQSQDRRDSAGTLLSVNTGGSASYRSSSSSSGLSGRSVPTGNRLSACSSGSGSRPGSTYTASGEDTGGYGGVAKEGGKAKAKASVRWGGVLVGGAEGREEAKREKERKKKEKKEAKEKRTSIRSVEARRRTPVTSVFPGLGLGGTVREEEAQENARVPESQQVPQVQQVQQEDEDEDFGDELEEACVRVAVHSTIPPFQVRGRERIGTNASDVQQTMTQPQILVHQSRQSQDIAQRKEWPSQDPAPQQSPVPPARPRPRPMSEQLLGLGGNGARSRPKGIVGSVTLGGEDPGEAFAISALEAANSDLASLINRLDLEATPDSKASRPVSFAITDPTTSSRMTLGEPESPVRWRGGFDDSPLKKKIASTSITSLRPYAHAQPRDKSSGPSEGAATLRGSSVLTVGRAAIPPVPSLVGRPIMPWSSLASNCGLQDAVKPLNVKPQVPTVRQNRFSQDVNVGSPLIEEDSVSVLHALRPPKYPHQRPPAPATSATAPRIRTSSSDLRARAAPFMRTPSVSSTFGSSLVTLATKTPGTDNDPVAPSSHTFGGTRPVARYTLPAVVSGSSSPRSVMTAGNDTPTPSPKPQQGHTRKGSKLVPFVKSVVESFEARTAQEQESRRDLRPKRRSTVTTSTSSARNDELDADARRELGFKGTMGVTDEEAVESFNEEDEDSDIPDELQVILSHSDDTNTSKIGHFPVDIGEDTLSYTAPMNASTALTTQNLPPSPGLPPAAPLPTPSSTPSVVGVPTMEPSPPAPTFLPVLEPSPSPPPVLSPSLAPPTFTVRAVSEDGANEADVDEPHTASSSSEDDTKQSFDFTGELKRLNESGGAHRRSFVEQLENAFKTPSKIGAAALGFEIRDFLGVNVLTSLAQNPNVSNETRIEDNTLDANLSMMVESLNESFNLLKPQPSVTSKPSYGQLDTEFKFGGKPQSNVEGLKTDESVERMLPGVAALSTAPSPKQVPSGLPHRRRASSVSMVEEDSFVLRSIYAHAVPDMHQKGHCAKPSQSLESDTSSKRRARKSHVPAHARCSSDTSFSGMSSFGAVRTKFEFSTERPDFFTQSLQHSVTHARRESMFSIASISSYGEVINNGSKDPFNYGQDVSANKDGLASINETMATFDENRHRKRFSTDSDVSSFYFRAPHPHVTQHKEHGRNQSVVSTNSVTAPPISLYNRSFGHKRSDSAGSANSIANAYGIHGASGGRAAWVRHRQDRSIDSVMSDFSAARLGRPGVGDKMFESAAADHGPLTSISASPPESLAGDLAPKSSYDSILDDDRRSTVDSIFDNTGQRSSMSSDSVFGYDNSEPVRGNLFPPAHFRPLSIISIGNHGSPHDDDTMISMLGGGHVRRRSIGSSFEASPCVRVEKREKRKRGSPNHQVDPYGYGDGSPNKARLVHRESIASSTSSKHKFGETRMTLAQQGLLHRNSLEDSCLSAEGEEDLSIHSIRSPVFTRPIPSVRARSRPLVTISQPPDTTPPLSSSEGSQSGESQSSIDIVRLKVLLQTASAGSKSSTARARARGRGHRRRASQMSRSSAIATIQEENPGLTNSPSPDRRANRDSFESSSSFQPSLREPEPLLEPSVDIVEWDDEHMVVGLRKYYALRSEADETISHSRTVWPDTPFSIHALQTFTPPDYPAGMQALLEHSQKSYIPLPHDLRPRRVRSRTSSFNRTSPYPRGLQRSFSPVSTTSTKSRRSSADLSASVSISSSFDRSRALQTIPVPNNATPPVPALAALTPFSPLALDLSRSTEAVDMMSHVPQSIIKPIIRPRVESAARRNALGWTKRKTPKTKTAEGKSTHANKENEALGLLTSPVDSLRIVRPRPRGRPAPMPTPKSTSLLI